MMCCHEHDTGNGPTPLAYGVVGGGSRADSPLLPPVSYRSAERTEAVKYATVWLDELKDGNWLRQDLDATEYTILEHELADKAQDIMADTQEPQAPAGVVEFLASVEFLFDKLRWEAQEHPLRIAELSQESVKTFLANTRAALRQAQEPQ